MVLMVFLVFAVSFIVFQQAREKQYKIGTLTIKLENYNELLAEDLALSPGEGIILQDSLHNKNVTVAHEKLQAFVREHESKDLRVTLVRPNGKVIYDNMSSDYEHFANHAKREEIAEALKNRVGSSVERQSKTLKHDYFYVASYFPESKLIIRTALPYNNDLAKIKGAIESVSQKINNRKLAKEEWIEIQNKKEEKESQVKELEEVKIKLQEEVKLIKEKLLEQMDLLKEKEKLDHKLALLNDLDKLFKGKKFVEFVAATRLKYVSLEASRKLKEVTNGNYGLEVDEDGKFIIRDYKNGGAGRDASTLSGGETFLASLALALALSAEIQLKGTAPLELFFLDEGFGTLDDNLLEVVMSSLERIHNDKLKVGIISHVESIKNRVPVKLLVTPAQAGMGGSKVKIERS